MDKSNVKTLEATQNLLMFKKYKLLNEIKQEIPQMFKYLKFIEFKMRQLSDKLEEFKILFDKIIA